MRGNINTYEDVCKSLRDIMWDEDQDYRDVRKARITHAFVDACKSLGIFVYYKENKDSIYTRLALKYKGQEVEFGEENGYLLLFLIVGRYDTDAEDDEVGDRKDLFCLFNDINKGLGDVRIFLRQYFTDDFFDAYGNEVVLSRCHYIGDVEWNQKVYIEPEYVSKMLHQLWGVYSRCRFAHNKPEALKII